MSAPVSDPTVSISVSVRLSTMLKLKIAAEKNGTSIPKLIRELIEGSIYAN